MDLIATQLAMEIFLLAQFFIANPMAIEKGFSCHLTIEPFWMVIETHFNHHT